MSEKLHTIERRPINDDAQIRDYLNRKLEPFVLAPNFYDLRSFSYEKITQFINRLIVNYAVVLHGSDRKAPHAILLPQFSRALTKVPSVFASTDARVAFSAGVFRSHGPLVTKIRYDIDGGNSFAGAMFVCGKKKIFEAPPGIATMLYEALQTDDTNDLYDELFTDGYIYICSGQGFVTTSPQLNELGQRDGRSGFTDHEVNSPDIVEPLAILNISKKLARSLFRLNGDDKDTITVYSEEDMVIRREMRERALDIRASVLARALGDLALNCSCC